MCELEDEINEKLVVSPVKCKSCGEQPKAFWKDGLVLGCDCGTREFTDAVPDNRFIPDGVSWTVVEDE